MFSRTRTQPEVKVKFSKIERRNYCTGETVSGVVNIDCAAWTKISSLRVLISGKEDCYIGTHEVKQRPVGAQTPITIKKHSRLDPGIYSYPFEFAIPTNLQPSISSPGSFNTMYSLRVELRLSKYKLIPFVDTYLLYIHKPAVKLLAPTFNAKLHRGVFRKHQTCLTCLPSSRTLQLYEPLKLDISIENQSRKNITRMIISLEKKVAKGKKHKEFSTVYQLGQMLHIAPEQYQNHIISFLVEEQVGLQIPASYQGHKVRVEYFIVFTLEFEGGGEWTSKMPMEVRSAPFGVKQRSNEPLVIPGWPENVVAAKAGFELYAKHLPMNDS